MGTAAEFQGSSTLTTAAPPARRPTPAAPVPDAPDYRFIKPIGRGAFGTVWLAEEPLAGVFRAIKVLDGGGRGRIPRADVAARELEGLHAYQTHTQGHPHLIQVFKTGRCTIPPLPPGEGRGEGKRQHAPPRQNTPHPHESPPDPAVYYVMEIADHALGARPHRPQDYEPLTLSTLIRRHGRLPPAAVIEHALALLDALEHLHKGDIRHRDVKPANCLFVGGVLKLADIGLASPDADESLGTDGFLPPDGRPDDFYALGKTLYEMLTGLPASRFPDWPGDLTAHGAQPPPAVIVAQASRLWPKRRFRTATTPDRTLSALRNLINRLCHPSPENRLTDLARCRAELQVLTSPPEPQGVSRRKAMMLALGIPLAACGGGGAVDWWHERHDPTRRRYGKRPHDGTEECSSADYKNVTYLLRRHHRPDEPCPIETKDTIVRFFDLQTQLMDGVSEVCGAYQIVNLENAIEPDITKSQGTYNQLWLVAAPDDRAFDAAADDRPATRPVFCWVQDALAAAARPSAPLSDAAIRSICWSHAFQRACGNPCQAGTPFMQLIYSGQPGADPGVKAAFGIRRENGIPLERLRPPDGAVCGIYLVLTMQLDPWEALDKVRQEGASYLDKRVKIGEVTIQ